MDPVAERVEFLHAAVDVDGQIGIDVVIVFYGVGRTGFSLYYMGIVGCDAVGTVVCCRGVLNDAGQPYMGYSEVFQRGDDFVVDVVEFARAVLIYVAAGNIGGVRVGEQARQKLICGR